MLQILTPNGWSDFDGVKKTKDRDVVHIDGLTCTPEHLLKDDRGVFVEARYHDKYIKESSHKADVYDVMNVDKGHQYYTNGVVSHNCVFKGSSNSLLTGETLEQCIAHEVIDKHGDIEIFEHPKEGAEYLITVDTSRGVGQDYSAFVVFDVSDMPYKVVAKYKNNRISPMVYPTIVYNAAIHYNEAQVLVEINDIGGQVSDILFHDLEYENLIQVSMEKNRQVMGMGTNPRLGVRTTVAVKSVGCANVKTMIEKGVLELRDDNIINEFGTFIPKGKSYEADAGCHDDLVMCCVMFAWATTQQYFIDMTDRDARKRVMEEAESRAYDDLAPFGMIESEMGTFDSETALFDEHVF